MRGALRICALLALLPAAATAQNDPTPASGSGAAPATGRIDAPDGSLAQAIITVDQESLFRDSAWGRRAMAALAEKTRQVAADNDRLFAQLSSEEAALTEQRKTLPPQEFRTRATAFDERVQKLRREREAAARELQVLSDAERSTFFRAAAPAIGAVMRERGAVVVLDPRTVLFSVEAIDVTSTVIARLDAEIGDGADAVQVPAQTPDATEGAGSPGAAQDPPAAPIPPLRLPSASADAPADLTQGADN